METPTTLSGAKLLSCDLDDSCPTLDCDAVMDEYTEALMENAAGIEFVSHYCGLDYLAKLPPIAEED